MPIYEYRCSACGFEKDALQKMSDPPLVDCPNCGQPSLVKLVSAAGFQLKGSGWYATDFKGSGTKPASKPAGGSDAAKPDSTDSAAARPSSEPAAAKAETPAPKPVTTPGSGD
jgi:putative FmdB family regulatory protein